jgi:hypothetical protein
MERAIAILPGGSATPGSGSANSARDSSGTVFKSLNQIGGSPTIFHRSAVRNWPSTVSSWPEYTDDVYPGRAVYIVDVETGVLIKKIGHTVFPSPVVGTPSVFQGDVGAIATRAFVSDVDGVIWRIDLSGSDPLPNNPKDGWTARPFHDMFWYRQYNQGMPSNEPPVLSVDAQGRVVVIHGSGYIDESDFNARDDVHTVVSLTEQGDFSGTTVDVESIRAAVNWELRLEASEMVTGPVELFDKVVLFSSYKKQPETNDDCDCGKSRLYALDYMKRDTGLQNSSDPTYEPTRVNLGSPFNLDKSATDLKDYIFMGVSLKKSLECISLTSVADAYLGQMRVPIPTAQTSPAVQLVVTASGGDKQQGSSLGSKTYTGPSPQSNTAIKSYGAACE